ncbi:hypothetical protein [Amycolatopsis pigmentata]|uniref:Uncharacterized protein n=1 Tax=Amycolatopsis pigmentata TaxID=450801 RepID=A0ABW5FRJ1_9PSEU
MVFRNVRDFTGDRDVDHQRNADRAAGNTPGMTTNKVALSLATAAATGTLAAGGGAVSAGQVIEVPFRVSSPRGFAK